MTTRGVGEDLAEHLAADGWPVFTTSSYPGRFRRLADMLSTCWRYRTAYSVAQVEVYSGAAFVWAELVAILLRIIGKPYVLTAHGGLLPEFLEARPFRAQHLFASAACVTAPSGYLAEKLSKYRAGVIVLPNAVDITACPFRRRDHPAPSLVWLRAYEKIYRPWLAVHALAELLRDYPDTTLTMIGPDRQDGSLEQAKQAARDRGVMDRVDFMGPIDKKSVPGRLARHDVFLNTTAVDNTPVSVIEAMACGLCVVSTSAGGIPHLLHHEKDALLVSANPDGCEIAGAVQRLLEDSSLAGAISIQARHTAEDCSWEAVLPRWERLLSSPVGTRA
ncbi:MAG: glycosyltransferase family 4 protein [Bryobacterales bacterium]|nr:glycosyltransferase family 4 protein [Bryobacterales bacterium]